MSTDHYSGGGSFPAPHGLKDLVESGVDIRHPWLNDLRAMVRLLRGELEPPHNTTDTAICFACDNARRLQAEARPVADIRLTCELGRELGMPCAEHKHILTLCKHGHLFTPCEWCEYDKLHLRETYRTFDEWHEMVGAEPDKVYRQG